VEDIVTEAVVAAEGASFKNVAQQVIRHGKLRAPVKPTAADVPTFMPVGARFGDEGEDHALKRGAAETGVAVQFGTDLNLIDSFSDNTSVSLAPRSQVCLLFGVVFVCSPN
jgi:hypothetical protein